MPQKLPALFLGHGNPMNALARNQYTRGLVATRPGDPAKPRAVLCISAHWYGTGGGVTAMAQPRTIHDFGGFPRELFEVQYPAPGDPALASRVRSLLAPVDVPLDQEWGLDHGAWSVLIHVFPEADVPVVQLRIDAAQPPAWHYALGRALRPLRDEGVLIVGSGNLVHNLMQYAWTEPQRPAYDWAARFEAQARAWISAGEHAPLSATRHWDGMRCSAFRRRSITCRCCTCWGRRRRGRPSRSRSRAWTGGRFRCWR